MANQTQVLILGANSDVAKHCIIQYAALGFQITAASRNTQALEEFIIDNNLQKNVSVLFFDAVDFGSHLRFYQLLPEKPHLVLYAAGSLAQNDEVFHNFSSMKHMMEVNFLGAVSILNCIVQDKNNDNLKRIIGFSSLSGVRGRKSNFMYGSTKAAFQTYLAGLRQELAPRKITVNVLTSGYIDTKINRGLSLNKNLMMKPEYVAEKIVQAGNAFSIIPDFRWKLIYGILKLLPENWVAKLP